MPICRSGLIGHKGLERTPSVWRAMRAIHLPRFTGEESHLLRAGFFAFVVALFTALGE